MDSISDIAGRKQAPQAGTDTTSPFLLRKLESNKVMAAKLAPSQESGTEGEDKNAINDFLIRGLIQRLPKPDTNWSLDERAKWLKTADSIFSLVYRAAEDEPREIKITIIEQQAGTYS